MIDLSFKSFLEYEEEKPNIFTAVRDNLGVDPKEFEKLPYWLANASIGKVNYNGIQYSITKLVKNDNGKVTGAMIQPLDIKGVKSTRAYVKKGDNQVRIPDSSVSGGEQFISVANLQKAITQGIQPPAAGGAGMGGAGGLPI